MNQHGLTARQRQLFDFVRTEITNGRPSPSFEEIKIRLGLTSRGNVHRLVDTLVERGWLVKLPYRARSLALPGTAMATECPGGAPMQVAIPAALAGRLKHFCEARHRNPAEVVREALDAHLRWPA